MPKNPTVTVTVDGQERTVEFGYATLARIEDHTQKTAFGLLAGFAAGAADTGEGAKEQLLRTAEGLSVRDMGAFVAACLDVRPDELPLPALMSTFAPLLKGLGEAMQLLTGADAENPAPRPTPAP